MYNLHNLRHLFAVNIYNLFVSVFFLFPRNGHFTIERGHLNAYMMALTKYTTYMPRILCSGKLGLISSALKSLL